MMALHFHHSDSFVPRRLVTLVCVLWGGGAEGVEQLQISGLQNQAISAVTVCADSWRLWSVHLFVSFVLAMTKGGHTCTCLQTKNPETLISFRTQNIVIGECDVHLTSSLGSARQLSHLNALQTAQVSPFAHLPSLWTVMHPYESILQCH